MKKTVFAIALLIISSSIYAQWQQTNGPFGNGIIRSFAKHGSEIYGGSYSFGVYRSTNNGDGWIQTSMNDKYVNGLHSAGGKLWVGTSDGSYVTTDNGYTWNITMQIPAFNFNSGGSRIFAACGVNGIYVTTNNGANRGWTGLQDRAVYSVAVNGNYVFAGIYNPVNVGMYISSDNGLTWNPAGFLNTSIFDLQNINGTYMLSEAGRYITQPITDNPGIH